MVYTEEHMSVFDVGRGYSLAQCISADFGMGKGIAIEFNKHFDMKNKMISEYPNFHDEWKRLCKTHACLYKDGVFNLVTKERYWHKPTYDSIEGALEDMKVECLLHGINKVAMPKIGCGLDRLEWGIVKGIIFRVFEDTSIEIKVCFY